jgi:hypothetical protein
MLAQYKITPATLRKQTKQNDRLKYHLNNNNQVEIVINHGAMKIKN